MSQKENRYSFICILLLDKRICVSVTCFMSVRKSERLMSRLVCLIMVNETDVFQTPTSEMLLSERRGDYITATVFNSNTSNISVRGASCFPRFAFHYSLQWMKATRVLYTSIECTNMPYFFLFISLYML